MIFQTLFKIYIAIREVSASWENYTRGKTTHQGYAKSKNFSNPDPDKKKRKEEIATVPKSCQNRAVPAKKKLSYSVNSPCAA